MAVADHPVSYAPGRDRPGTAFADLAGGGVPECLRDASPVEDEPVGYRFAA
ncbi:MAG: hypothetical protein U0793_34565 [Gemmataceae bacterium]